MSFEKDKASSEVFIVTAVCKGMVNLDEQDTVCGNGQSAFIQIPQPNILLGFLHQ